MHGDRDVVLILELLILSLYYIAADESSAVSGKLVAAQVMQSWEVQSLEELTCTSISHTFTI